MYEDVNENDSWLPLISVFSGLAEEIRHVFEERPSDPPLETTDRR